MLATALLLAAALQTIDALQPRTLTSPSGDWELFVDPSSRTGKGPSRCVVRRNGEELWRGELPFTFQEAVINDRGVSAGYAFTGGRPLRAAIGELVVAIVSPDGATAFEERVELVDGDHVHDDPKPRVRGLLLQPELDRFILRVEDASWWSYDLQAASLHSKRRVAEDIEGLQGNTWSMAAHAVPGTPLIISQWYERNDARFVLLDQNLQDVWSLEFPHDYAEVDGKDPFYEVRDAGGAILSTADGRFDLRSVAEGSRRSFSVAPDANAPGGWTVTEASRVPYVPEAPAVVLPEITDLELRFLSAVALQTGVAEPPIVRNVLEFDVAASGEIRFLRDEGGAVTQVRLRPDGGLLEELRLDPYALAAKAEFPQFHWEALPGDAWQLAIFQGFDMPDALWRFDGRTGQARQLHTEALGHIEELAAFQGGIVVGSSWLKDSYPWKTLVCLDMEGRTIWSLNARERRQDLWIDGLAVHDSGRCAIVVPGFKELRIFTPGGQLEVVLGLEEILPRPPGYSSGLHPDLDGGWLLYNYNSRESPPVWRLAADGSVLGGLTPRLPDGSQELDLARVLRREEDGRLWTTDGTALYQLDDEGTVARTVGSKPEVTMLAEAAGVQIDRLGRVLVRDGRTGAFHLFDGTGARLALVPDPEGNRMVHAKPYVAVRDDGRFLVRVKGRNLEYAPDGTLIGEAELTLRHPRFQPGLGTAWGLWDGEPARVASDGRVLRSLPRFPDGAWFDQVELAVGPDGSLVVYGEVQGEDFHRLEHYDAEGEHRRSLRIPAKGFPIVHGNRVVLEYFGPVVHVVDLEKGTVQRVSVDRPGEEKATWTYGISPDGSELWAVSWKTLKLYRFELPR